MIQSISNAFRIGAAEQAIERHNNCFNRDESGMQHGCTAQDAADLLISMSHWAEVNGLCMRIKPVHVFSTEETDGGE
jgi:hypothetical protein